MIDHQSHKDNKDIFIAILTIVLFIWFFGFSGFIIKKKNFDDIIPSITESKSNILAPLQQSNEVKTKEKIVYKTLDSKHKKPLHQVDLEETTTFKRPTTTIGFIKLPKDKDKDGVLDKDDLCPEIPGLVSKKGCPITKIPTSQLKLIKSYARQIKFELGNPNITYKKPLNNIAKILKKYPDANIIIEGHTDDSSSDVVSNILSKDRATSVRYYLKRRGVSNKMQSVGKGSKEPIVSNSDYENKKMNERIDIKVYY